MNAFSTFSGMSVRVANNPNSLVYINRFAKPITLDLSGLNTTDLSATPSYHISAAGLNTTNQNTSLALLKYNNRPLVVSDFSTSGGSYTIMFKHAASQSPLSPLNFLYPNVVKLSAFYTSVGQDFSAQFYSSLSPGTIVPYVISGCTSEDLNGASLTGTFAAPYQTITYSVASGTGSTIAMNISGGTVQTITITNSNAIYTI